MKKNNRRATVATDVAIDDNWIELNAPELALPTSAPAIDAFSGGRASAHLGRFGAAISSVVRIPQASSSHAQTARHGTRTNSIFGGSNNRRIWHGERKESTKTLNAVAVASNIVTAFVLEPGPGPQRRTRSNWFDILPEEPRGIFEETNDCAGSSEGSSLSDENRTATTDSETSLSFGCVSHGTPDTEIASITPDCVHFGTPPPIQIPIASSYASRRASSLPLPNEYIQPGVSELGQIVMIESTNPLCESPAPFTSDAITSFSIQQQEPSTSITSARSILEGLARLFEAVDRQTTVGYASTIPSPQNARNSPYFSDFPAPIDDRDWDICNLTPATVASSWHTADARERKLLIIGSGYDSENFRRATTETNATLATLNTLHGVSHDVKSLTSIFKKRSFMVETLVGNMFDAQTVLNTVKNFLSDATEGDVRAIVFTGHATRTQADGKVAIVPPIGCHKPSNPDEGLISADAWREAVNQSTQPGVIVLSIFASCLSGGLMDQPINIRDLNGPIATEVDPPSSKPSSPAPIFITFASSQFDQNTYESIVGHSKDPDSPYRHGDHFLRAFTLAARDSRALDWEGFIRVLEEKFSQLRVIGAYCAANDPDIRDLHWLENHPQVPVYSSSRFNLPALEDVLPWEISLFKREPSIPGLSRSINVAEEFLAHVSLCGETPEITHYTLPTPSNVVPPVVL
ncbi:unnamed protein product [Rhizoctonia solani]|uniref:Peptidase C14 caspase domain-containing protein n=1 Tax=Rhizoctonia solani TaxID=456999 RepID=A0A8H3BEU6_9AGAM|nr:unnamed protein product [Rhizoctonia solani]